MSRPLSPELPAAPVPFEDTEPQIAPFPVVGVGASAGGLKAFARFLEALPIDTGMAFVLIQHLDPAHKSLLTEILSKSTAMKVLEVVGGMSIEPNQIYVIPPNTMLQAAAGLLELTPRPASPGPHLPIDYFFQSLAREQGRLSIGVVLSGTGSDGSEGLKAIKSACGITFAQDEESAEYAGMPRDAVATGIVDFVLAPAQIAVELERLSHNHYLIPPREQSHSEVLPTGEGELSGLFSNLLQVTGIDFRHYKQNTIRRRVGRRMIVHRFEELGDYLRFVQSRPEEVRELYRDLLINVTSFFRDPEAFAALAIQLQQVSRENRVKDSFRAWIPGCSTGEEVYSLAICVNEVFEQAGFRPSVQFFGTDISEAALETARAGRYPERILHEVSADRLNRYFTKVDGAYQISKEIREMCVFARHDLTRDTPFTHLDLVSCRNLLIYLEPVMQSAIFPIFHYALNLKGLLLLGSAETVGSSNNLFSAANPKQRIFLRGSTPSRLHQSIAWHHTPAATVTETQVANAVTNNDLQRRVDRTIQRRYSLDGVVIDADWTIRQFRGHTGFYLEPAPGEASHQLLRMAQGELQYSLHEVISNAMKQNAFVEKKRVRVEQRGEVREIGLEVTPLDSETDGERFYLVVFSRLEGKAGQPAREQLTQISTDADTRTKELEQQLADAVRYQQFVAENHDAALEEVRAINEELRSANEELQSSNEELGTTKEELQSANEELITVNEELDTRNQQLATLNDDLNNLFVAVDSPILRVDRELCLRRFTPSAEKALGLRPTDLKFAVGHVLNRLGIFPDIEPLIREVLEDLTVQTHQLQGSAGHWWSVSIRPYRTIDHRIEGAVLTFTNTDSIQRALQLSNAARQYADAIVETVREPLLLLNSELKIERANESFYEFFHLTPAEAEGQLIFDLGSNQWNTSLLRSLLLEDLLPKAIQFAEIEVKQDVPVIGERVLLINGRKIGEGALPAGAILLTLTDITDRQNAEAVVRNQIVTTSHELDRSKEELRALAGRLLNAQDEAQQRIARELHDDLSQRLAVLEIEIEAARLAMGKPDEKTDAILALLQQRVLALSEDVRDISHRMHPSVLDHLGLVAALQGLVDESDRLRSHSVHFTHDNIPLSLPAQFAGSVYRITQEALNNAAKYAGKSPVTVTLTADEDTLRLSVIDGGQGFDIASVRSKGGLGLTSMQERAYLLGGHLGITSQPGEGTTLLLTVPLPQGMGNESMACSAG